MYYICKTVSENWVEPDIDDQKQQGSASFHYLKNWHEIKAVLDLLAPISSLNDEVNQIKGCLPSQGEFTGPTCMFPTGVRNTFTQKMSSLRLKVETIEGVLRNNYNHDLVGIDIKLPHNMNLADMGRYIRDLDFILQCPLFVLDNTRIEVSSVDRGSIWINIGIVGTMVDFFVNRLSEIVDKILVIRSHYLTSKEQEARLRQLELKTEVLEGVVSGFELAHKTAKQEAIDTVLGEGVDADFDTLKEVADWIQSDTTNSAQLISRVSAIEADYLKVADKSALQTEIDALETLVGTLPEGAVSTTVVAYIQEVVDGLKIGDYAKASELTALAARVTQTENDIKALKTRATTIETKLGTVDKNAQENVIEIIKVNGVAQTVTEKAVDIAVPAGALAEKDKVSAADLDGALTTTIDGKADTEDLAAVALSGNIADLEQAEDDYLVLNCGTATTVI